MNHYFQAKEKQTKDNQCSKLRPCIVPLPLSLLVSPGFIARLCSQPSRLEYLGQLPGSSKRSPKYDGKIGSGESQVQEPGSSTLSGTE